jgi:hypothetical protein
LRVCTAIKATGERCKAGAISGSEWCWNHDPAHAEKRRRHGSKGGRRGGRTVQRLRKSVQISTPGGQNKLSIDCVYLSLQTIDTADQFFSEVGYTH